MAVAQKVMCVVDQVIPHGERVYTLALKPERPVPRFRPGQFLHLAIDPYDPSGFWPESRAFSITSSPAERTLVKITYAVHGAFTQRMERDLMEGRQVWIKMPYGDFVVDDRADVALFAGGTGISAFTAFLEALSAAPPQTVTVAYGARTSGLLIYRDVVERCAGRIPSVGVAYFVEEGGPGAPTAVAASRVQWHSGRIGVDPVWPRLPRPLETEFYLSGPPPMLRSIRDELRARNVSPEAIHIDAWE